MMVRDGLLRNREDTFQRELLSPLGKERSSRDMTPAKRADVSLMGVTFTTQNMGVSALAAGTVKCAAMGIPGARLSILDYGKEPDVFHVPVNGDAIQVPLVNLRFSKKFYLKNNIALLIALTLIGKIIPFRRGREWLLRKNPYLFQINKTGVFAAISGGDSFSDIYGIGRFLYVSLPQVLVLLMGKPLVLLPQTLGPFKGRLTRWLATWIIRRSVITYSRDWEGVKEWRERLGKSGKQLDGSTRETGNEIFSAGQEPMDQEKVRFSFDVGFVLEPIRPEPMDLGGLPGHMEDGRLLVGLNVSGLLYEGGYSGKNMFRLKTDYRDLMMRLIDFFVSEKKATVLLVPHVFGSEAHSESDQVACKKIMNETGTAYEGRIFLTQGVYNQSEIKYIIGKCDFFIGSRMHACIAALSQCIPTVGIAYSRKFRGVMDSIGVGEIVADPRKLSEAELLHVVDRVWTHRDTIREQLKREIPQVKEKALRLFEGIAAVTGLGRASAAFAQARPERAAGQKEDN